jgi:hypothetical protein
MKIMSAKMCEPRIVFLVCSLIYILNIAPALTAFGQVSLDDSNNIYDLRIADKNYPIKYQITGTGNKVSNISAEADNATLLVNVLSQSNGRLSIELPRTIIDSKKQGDVDDRYVVFQDGQATSPEEIVTNNQTRTLAIDFDKGIGQIEISGSKILPEFGAISALVFAVSTGAMIVVRMKLHKPQY